MQFSGSKHVENEYFKDQGNEQIYTFFFFININVSNDFPRLPGIYPK